MWCLSGYIPQCNLHTITGRSLHQNTARHSFSFPQFFFSPLTIWMLGTTKTQAVITTCKITQYNQAKIIQVYKQILWCIDYSWRKKNEQRNEEDRVNWMKKTKIKMIKYLSKSCQRTICLLFPLTVLQRNVSSSAESHPVVPQHNTQGRCMNRTPPPCPSVVSSSFFLQKRP